MRLLRQGLDLDGFFERLRDAPARALVLDYDGTLAPFRERRESALPYPGVREMLHAIQAAETLLVLVSGRPAESLEGLIGLSRAPEVWGSHGRERSRDGRRETGGELPEADRRALSVLAGWIAGEAGESALERKPFGVAVHWRDRAPLDAARLRQRAIERFRSATAGTDLEVLERSAPAGTTRARSSKGSWRSSRAEPRLPIWETTRPTRMLSPLWRERAYRSW